MAKIKIGGIIQCKDLAEISVTMGEENSLPTGTLFKILGSEQINIQFIAESTAARGERSVVFCIDQADLEATLKALDGPLKPEDITSRFPVGIVSVFGPHFREKPSIAGTMFSTLENAGVQILAISTSISTLSCVVEESSLSKAVHAISDAFELP